MRRKNPYRTREIFLNIYRIERFLNKAQCSQQTKLNNLLFALEGLLKAGKS